MSDLSEVATRSESAYNWTNVICNSLFIMATLVIFIIIIKQGTFKYFPNSLKVCLIGFFVGYTAFEIDTIQMIITDSRHTVFNIIGRELFMVSHWLFTSHYLSTACLFNLIYLDEDLEQQRRIKLRLLILDIVIYSTAILVSVIAFIIPDTHVVIEIYWAL